MSDDHSCHCAHVVVIQTKITLVQWLMGIIAAGVVGLLISKVGDLVSLRIKNDLPPIHSGERLYQDRVEHEP